MKHNAQNQHYVSKFMLRNFLSDPNKEQVTVYDKHKDRVFVTSIRNIMAERRFNDFVDDEWIVSFEPVVTEIENLLISTYKGILDRRCLRV